MGLPKKRQIACAHHKTGSTFTGNLFKDLSVTFKLRQWPGFRTTTAPENWRILIHQHARVIDVLPTADFRGWHTVRHPVGLVRSAAAYHARANEDWMSLPLSTFDSNVFHAFTNTDSYNVIRDPEVPLYRKLEVTYADYSPHYGAANYWEAPYDFAGKSYREFCREIEDPAERMLFEMRCYSRGVIQDMLAFPSDARFFRAKLEDVSFDPGMKTIREGLEHLGYTGAEFEAAVDLAQKHCVWFRGKSRHGTGQLHGGKVEMFPEPFLKEEYRRLFGWAEDALGY